MHRILIIGFLPGTNGISTSVMNLYRALDRCRFQFDFLIAKGDRKRFKKHNETEIRSLGGNVYYLNYSHRGFPSYSRRKLRELLCSIPDLAGVHVHDLSLLTYPLYLAGRLHLPVRVIHCHTAASKSETAVPTKNRSVLARLRLIAGDSFDRLACSDLAGIYDYQGLPFRVFPNAVDIDRFSFRPLYRALIRKKLGIEDDAVVFGFVGNVYEVKNPFFAVKVFAQYRKTRKNSHMLLCGNGKLIKEVLQYTEKQGLSNCCHILGSQSEIELFYSAMDLLLCPSKSEGLPNVLVEAQASGLPCLISDEITDQARITDLVHTASIKKGPQAWAVRSEEILRKQGPRKTPVSALQRAGYDIRQSAALLMDLYQRRIDEAGCLTLPEASPHPPAPSVPPSDSPAPDSAWIGARSRGPARRRG